MKQKIILYPPTLNWDFLTQRPQQIVKQFARKRLDSGFLQ